MVDPIVTPPHPPVIVPDPLPATVALNPPMVGTASPFVRVDGQNRDLILESIRAWARGPLVDWSNGWQADLTKWLGDTDDWLDSWNTEVVRYVEDVLQAVVDNSVEIQDPVVADLMAEPTSLTFMASADVFPAYRVWDGTAYPPRIPNAVNIFFGPVNPELIAAPGDYWANPAQTTLDDVVANVYDTSSDLHTAIETVTDLATQPVTPHPLTAGVVYGSALIPGVLMSGWQMPGDAPNSINFDALIPPGWVSARVRVYIAAATGGNVRLSRTAASFKSTAVAPTAIAQTNHTAAVSANQVTPALITGDIPVAGVRHVNVTVRREAAGGTGQDTINGIVTIVGVELVKVA